MYEYNAIIKSVIDASTIEATLDLGFGVTIRRVFRIKHSTLTKDESYTLKPRAIGILFRRRVVIYPTKIGRHGRYEAEIFVPHLKKDYLEALCSESDS